MANTFGTRFKVTTFGESHGTGIGCVIDGCPSQLIISQEEIQRQLNRRRPGQKNTSTSRKETDLVEILSGIENNVTLGSPITLFIKNNDIRKSDYTEISEIPRPSHADFTYLQKYGIKSSSGGGRASARETAARVAAGSIAQQFLKQLYNIEIIAWVSCIGDIFAPKPDYKRITQDQVNKNSVRTTDSETADKMQEKITTAKKEKDSIGGIISCCCRNVPAGLGEPVFYKLDALLAYAMLSIPAAKGFEIGSGFNSAHQYGSEHNDVFIKKGDSLGTKTNNSGGVQGGISNGEAIVFKVAFKPTASIEKTQNTADYNGNQRSLSIHGRHDPCIVPRAVPVVEAMGWLVMADLVLCNIKKENKQ
jgi:chorismate synthase